MSLIAKFPGIERLSVEERIALIEEIQESIWADESAASRDEAYIVEMERRLAEAEAHPENLISWDEAIAARLGGSSDSSARRREATGERQGER